MHEDDKAPFTEHLEELRKRLITCFAAILVGFILTYAFKEDLYQILLGPLPDLLKNESDSMVFTHLTEPFFTYLKVAGLAGIMLAAPVIFYQFWMFIAPGLYSQERKLLLPVVCLSSFFFVGGALFGYFVVFPLGFKFFLGFTTETIRPMLSMREYLGFSAKLLLAFGIAFELPLVLTFLARLGIVSTSFLKKNRKYAILIFFIGSAILTPPDVISQVMMSIPLMGLYELSIFGAKIFGKKKSGEAEAEEEVNDESAEA